MSSRARAAWGPVTLSPCHPGTLSASLECERSARPLWHTGGAHLDAEAQVEHAIVGHGPADELLHERAEPPPVRRLVRGWVGVGVRVRVGVRARARGGVGAQARARVRAKARARVRGRVGVRGASACASLQAPPAYDMCASHALEKPISGQAPSSSTAMAGQSEGSWSESAGRLCRVSAGVVEVVEA